MNEPKEIYRAIISVIAKDKINMFGKIAVAQINSVQGVTIDDGGNIVSLDGDCVSILDSIVERFEKMIGVVSTNSIKITIESIIRENPDVKLPAKLK